MSTTEQRFNPVIALAVIAAFVLGILALIVGWEISIIVLGSVLVLVCIWRYAVLRRHLLDTILTVIGGFCIMTGGICGLVLESNNNTPFGFLLVGMICSSLGSLTTYRKQS
jgi:hypothetical protein